MSELFRSGISRRWTDTVIRAPVLIAFTCRKLHLGLSSEDAVCKGVTVDGLADLPCCGPVDGIQDRDQFPHTGAWEELHRIKPDNDSMRLRCVYLSTAWHASVLIIGGFKCFNSLYFSINIHDLISWKSLWLTQTPGYVGDSSVDHSAPWRAVEDRRVEKGYAKLHAINGANDTTSGLLRTTWISKVACNIMP